MAVLSSYDGRYALEFVLLPLEEAKHEDWIGYELHMLDVRTGKRSSLVSQGSPQLFLDRTVEPELPALCAAMRRVVAVGGAFTFTPVDERDFVIDVVGEVEGACVKVQFDAKPASDEFGWPKGQRVSNEKLLEFVEQLEAMYRAMCC